MKTYEEEKDLYEMKLHESIIHERWTITRVPSGWIYSYEYGHGGIIFVPFNDQFQ